METLSSHSYFLVTGGSGGIGSAICRLLVINNFKCIEPEPLGILLRCISTYFCSTPRVICHGLRVIKTVLWPINYTT